MHNGAMRVNRLVVLAALAACGRLNHATPAPERRLAVSLELRQIEVSSGLKIVVLPDERSELVQVDVRFDVGAAQDPPGKAGLAHLAEHLSFQLRAVAGAPALGTSLGDAVLSYNGVTTWDYTHMMALAPAKQLPTLTSLEALRMSGCAGLDQATFEREREVVRNELRESFAGPGGGLPALLLADVYPDDHPYHRPVAGDDTQLAALTLADVCRFLDDYYAPQHATVLIAGGFTHAALQAAIEPLTMIPHHGEPVTAAPAAPAAPKRRKAVHALDVEETTVFVMWPLPKRYGQYDAAARFVQMELERRARFFANTYEYATDVDTLTLGGPRAPVLVLAVSLKDADEVDQAVADVRRSAEGVGRSYDAERLSHAKNELTGQLLAELEPLAGRSLRFADYLQFGAADPYLELQAINEVTVGDVQAVAGAILGGNRAVIAVVKPKVGGGSSYQRATLRYSGAVDGAATGARAVDAAEANEAMAVPARASVLAAATRFELGNGMRVALLPSNTLPVVTVRLTFDAGTAQEPADKAGLAQLAALLLEPQDTQTTQSDMNASFDLWRSGADFEVAVDDDQTMFRLRGLSMYVDLMVKGLERLVKAGNYSQDEIERFRGRQAAQLKRRSYQRALAFVQTLYREVYGDAHPYAVKGFPTAKSVGRINRDETYAFKARHYSAENATLVVAGNFDPKLVEGYIRETFGDWPRGKADARVPAEADERLAPGYVGVVGDDGPVIEVRIAYGSFAGVNRLAERLVLASMVGARVAAVRDRLGASYGASASDDTRAGPGMLVVSSAVDAERAGEALATLRAAVASLRQTDGAGFAEDFVLARRAVVEELVANFNESSTLAMQLGFLAKYDLPAAYYDELLAAVASMTPTDLTPLIASELAPEQEVVVLLGGRKPLERAFAGADLTGVRWVE